MKLIDLLKQELPKRGGWPDGVKSVEQDGKGVIFEMDSDYCSDFTLMLCDDWELGVVTREQYEEAVPNGWNGEGLPPVGAECEYKLTNVNYRTDFSRGKVLAYGVQKVFMEHCSSKNEFIQSIVNIEFRPIRTERDKAIEEMLDLINAGTQLSLVDAIEQLYDAGYRKV